MAGARCPVERGCMVPVVMECAELVPIFRGSTRPWSPAPPRPALTARPQSSLLSAGNNNTRYTPLHHTSNYYYTILSSSADYNLLANINATLILLHISDPL